MRRFKFAGSHLLISALIGAAVIAFFYLVWYPGPLARIQGANLLAMLIIGIDVVLGPTMTAILASQKKSKKALIFDLIIIGALQIGALIYGIAIASESRPAYLVGTPQRFTVVSANDLSPKDPPPKSPYDKVPWFGAPLVGAKLPEDSQAKQKLLDEVLSGGADLELRPGYYQTYDSLKADIYKDAYPLSRLFEKQPKYKDAVTNWLKNKDHSDLSAVRYQPLIGREDIVIMLLAADGSIIGPYDAPAD